MLYSDNHYVLINWNSFQTLPNNRLRLIYFYFSISIHSSRYFTECSLDQLVDSLYSNGIFNTAQRRERRVTIRKLLLIFVVCEYFLFDFDYYVIYKNRIVDGIRIHRNNSFVY
uniref:hypothetical protein n=1 Tax=Anunuuluaehu liula TaxID=3049639 RepID=UPI00300115B6